jgi:hypothetical protein
MLLFHVNHVLAGGSGMVSFANLVGAACTFTRHDRLAHWEEGIIHKEAILFLKHDLHMLFFTTLVEYSTRGVNLYWSRLPRATSMFVLLRLLT